MSEYSILNVVNTPYDVKNLSTSELKQLSQEIRSYLISILEKTGGHLASNLGVVELTIALHYVFDAPKDKLCWDVGHQTYIHKILTGRKNKIPTVRELNGLSGFTQVLESEYDNYSTGHAGTAISQATAEKIATQHIGIDSNSLAIVGDASITTGMSLEALNHAGYIKLPIIVILNDNNMSISPSVGAFNHTLNLIRSFSLYNRCKKYCLFFIRHLPFISLILEKIYKRFYQAIKLAFYGASFFEDLGFKYLGPIDGHDISVLIKELKQIKGTSTPVLLHIVTKKGKGYKPAEENPIKFHGLSSNKTPAQSKENLLFTSLSSIVGDILTELLKQKKDSRISVITPAMKEGSGLTKFAEEFPDSFFDVGIAEQHATTLAGGLAKAGMTPFLCIYSTFLQRGYDQLIHDICLMKLPVRLVIDRAGCVGEDGETHQGVYDIAYMYPLPYICLLSVENPEKLIEILYFMLQYKEGPIAVRIPKRKVPLIKLDMIKQYFTKASSKEILGGVTKQKGEKIILFAEGTCENMALDIANYLEEKYHLHIHVEILYCIKPLPMKNISHHLIHFNSIFTLEKHVRVGGFGEHFLSTFKNNLENCVFYNFGYSEDKPLPHGAINDVHENVGFTVEVISKKIIKLSS